MCVRQVIMVCRAGNYGVCVVGAGNYVCRGWANKDGGRCVCMWGGWGEGMCMTMYAVV